MPYAFILDSDNDIHKVKFEYKEGKAEIKIGSFSHKLKVALDPKDSQKVSVLKVCQSQHRSSELNTDTPGGTPSPGDEVLSQITREYFSLE